MGHHPQPPFLDPPAFDKGFVFLAPPQQLVLPVQLPGRAAFQGIADIDARIVDGAVNGVGTEVRSLSGILRRVQNGFIRSYAAIISIAVVLMFAWFLLRGVL